MSVVISKPCIGLEVEQDHPGQVTAWSVSTTEALVLSAFCLDSGCPRVWQSTWAVEGGTQWEAEGPPCGAVGHKSPFHLLFHEDGQVQGSVSGVMIYFHVCVSC